MEGSQLLSPPRGPELVEVSVSDAADGWRSLGFSVDAGTVRIGRVLIRTGSAGTAPGWGFEPAIGLDAIDGIELRAVDGPVPPASTHANGVVAVDHAVVLSPAVLRTSAALEQAGFPLRRVRELDGGTRQQRFFWAGSTIVELAGPVEPDGNDPARLWGLALVSGDLDQTAARLGEKASAPRPAVQPGRRIVTIRSGPAGPSLALAVMSAP